MRAAAHRMWCTVSSFARSARAATPLRFAMSLQVRRATPVTRPISAKEYAPAAAIATMVATTAGAVTICTP